MVWEREFISYAVYLYILYIVNADEIVFSPLLREADIPKYKCIHIICIYMYTFVMCTFDANTFEYISKRYSTGFCIH